MHGYSKILLNDDYPNQWFLCDPIIDGIEHFNPADLLGQNIFLETTGVTVDIYPETVRCLHWHHGELMLPIVDYAVWEIIGPMIKDDVQALSCRVKGIEEEFLLLNLLHRIDCIDEEHSQVVYASQESIEWDLKHRSGFVSKYRDVSNLRIDSSKVGDHRLFRTKYWPARIIRNDVRDAFLAAGFKGPKFDPV